MTALSSATSLSSSSPQPSSSSFPLLLSQPYFQRLEGQIQHQLEDHRARASDASHRVLRQLITKHATAMQPLMRQFLLERALQITEQRTQFLAWLDRSTSGNAIAAANNAAAKSGSTPTSSSSSTQPQQQRQGHPSSRGGATSLNSGSDSLLFPSSFLEWHQAFLDRVAVLDALHVVTLDPPIGFGDAKSTPPPPSGGVSTASVLPGDETFVLFEATMPSAMIAVLATQAVQDPKASSLTSSSSSSSSLSESDMNPLEKYVRKSRDQLERTTLSPVQKLTVEGYLNLVLDGVGKQALFDAAADTLQSPPLSASTLQQQQQHGEAKEGVEESSTSPPPQNNDTQQQLQQQQYRLWSLVETLSQRVALRDALDWVRKEAKVCALLSSRGPMSGALGGGFSGVSCPPPMLATPTSFLQAIFQFYTVLYQRFYPALTNHLPPPNRAVVSHDEVEERERQTTKAQCLRDAAAQLFPRRKPTTRPTDQNMEGRAEGEVITGRSGAANLSSSSSTTSSSIPEPIRSFLVHSVWAPVAEEVLTERELAELRRELNV